jgi:predicted phosphodiesterase
VRLAWVTDIHLNFVSAAGRTEFYGRIAAEQPDALLVGGDTGEAPSVIEYLEEMESRLAPPVYFVLGNHDFYRGSIAEVRERALRIPAAPRRLRWLPAAGVVPLTPQTALIGHDSWADGRLGDFFRSEVLLNDYVLIRELRRLRKQELLARLNALGDEAAKFLELRAREALAVYRNVLVLTHLPPFREACWHEGQISSDEYLPHFACRAVGERLSAVMCERPDRTMTVLCGHTHSPGVAQIHKNLAVLTGKAEYGTPELQRILEVE